MQATPMTLSNGIFLQARTYEASSHLDKAHLLQMQGGKNEDAADLGMITPWITTGQMERPAMWDLIGAGKNRTLYMDGHLFKWKQPIPEGPTFIVADVSGVDRPGLDETVFKIKLNKRTFGNSAIISPNKFGGLELYVTADEIKRDGDGFVYTVKLNSTNKKYKFFPKDYLVQGTQFFQIGSLLGEYSQTYNDMGDNLYTGGYREFYNYVGEGFANAHFTCTRDAAISSISKSCVIGLQQYQKVIEMYQLRPGSAAYDISKTGESPISAYMKKGMTAAEAQKEVRKDIVKQAWIPEVEKTAMTLVERDVENYAMWGAGGVIEVEGKQKVRLPIGAFHQLNLGPTFTYNIPSFNLKKLDAILTSRLKDKIDPYGTNKIVIGTGLGGLKLVRQQIKDVAVQDNLVFDSQRYVKGTDNQMLMYDGPQFISYRMSFGVVEFKHIPSLDPLDANPLENPMVDGHYLSSYMFIIDDLTANNDNIYEIVYGHDWDFHHFYINGRMNYLDSTAFNANRGGRYQASNKNPGFEVYIEKPHKAYWIKDITRSLLIKPYNPKTGKPLFEPVY